MESRASRVIDPRCPAQPSHAQSQSASIGLHRTVSLPAPTRLTTISLGGDAMRFSEANLLPDGRHDETTLGDMRARWPFLAERLRAVLPARTGLRSRKKSDALLIRRE